MCGRYRISGLPVVDADNVLIGIVTNRDMQFEDNRAALVRDVMTTMPLVTAPVGVSSDDALALMRKHKVEKIPIVDGNNRLKGLITVKDFTKSDKYPNATKDGEGRLSVGAAVGVGEDAFTRAMTLVEAASEPHRSRTSAPTGRTSRRRSHAYARTTGRASRSGRSTPRTASSAIAHPCSSSMHRDS